MNLQKIIIDFCIDHIKWIVLLTFVSFIFVIIGRQQEWGEIRRLIDILFAILTVILAILVIIYLGSILFVHQT